MKHCKNCNCQYPDDTNFCTRCGQPLSVVAETETVEAEAEPQPEPPSPTPVPKKKKGKKILKRIIIALGIIVVVGVLWISHIMNAATYLILNSDGELFAKSGGETSIGIDYDGYAWEISYSPSWVDIDEFNNRFTINCQPNRSGRDREDHITVKSGKLTCRLPIGQFGEVQELELSESNLTCDKDGGSIYINISTDGLGPDISYPKFCQVEDLTPSGFTLNVSANSEYSRSGIIEATEDGRTATISIYQEGICTECDGRGYKDCSYCNGTGYSGWGYYTSLCSFCNGSGRINCYSCSGTGVK